MARLWPKRDFGAAEAERKVEETSFCNVLLVPMLQALGGAKYMFLTHRDDVADHARWAKELGLQRIIHKTEANRSQGTKYALIALDTQTMLKPHT